MSGPLAGLKVVEIAGLGPAPFCAMLLADQGAQVVRIARPGTVVRPTDVLARGRVTVELDLRQPEGVAAVLEFLDTADALIEGFRPGVMERLGLGPDVCLARRPALVYGRMTGWGQQGPLAQAAGHDLNYVALSGALLAIGNEDRPPSPPLNLVGDFGGGGMLLAFGIACALLQSRSCGQGQVVDAAMTDGAALLSSMVYGWRAEGRWSNERESNLLDGGAPFYACYRCADGKHIAVGALEPEFFGLLVARCELADVVAADQYDKAKWPLLRQRLAALFLTRTRDQWCELLEGTDACVAPVLDWDEAPRHAHNRARGTFVELNDVVQPQAAPRFSRTPGAARPGEHKGAREFLATWQASRRAESPG
jgi:alpha-methylacyl-CoA racemase